MYVKHHDTLELTDRHKNQKDICSFKHIYLKIFENEK